MIPQPYRHAEARIWVDQAASYWREGTAAPFAVTRSGTEEVVGGVGFRWIGEEVGVGEVGYWLRREARGDGLTTRGVRLLSRWAFEALACERLQLRADERNVPSQRVAEKADFRGSDHEVDVDRGAVEPLPIVFPHGGFIGGAERDVTRRVLVEERVVEDGVERPDPAFPVDEGQLAEANAALVLLDQRPQSLGAPLRVDLHRTTALEAHREAVDDPALRVQRLRRAHRPVHALRIRRREHLLRGEVRHVRNSFHGLLPAADPA